MYQEFGTISLERERAVHSNSLVSGDDIIKIEDVYTNKVSQIKLLEHYKKLLYIVEVEVGDM